MREPLCIFVSCGHKHDSCSRYAHWRRSVYSRFAKSYTIIFQRPASQHGWVVRKRNTSDGKCNYDKGVIGVIEVNVSDAKAWLGNGELLSQENFFPSYEIDQGYRVLLERQHRSGLGSTYRKLLPVKTIRNYHLEKSFYCSDRSKEIRPVKPLLIKGKEVQSLVDLYAILLTCGWRENSRSATKPLQNGMKMHLGNTKVRQPLCWYNNTSAEIFVPGLA